MKQLALVALDDADVDILSRLRQRDDLKLEAVYHPDPGALIVRLAGLAHVPIVKDLAQLSDLPIDLWVGGDQAAVAMTELRGRAVQAGKTVPLYVPAYEIDEFLRDPESWHPGAAVQSPAATIPVDLPAEPVAPMTEDHEPQPEESTTVNKKEAATARPEVDTTTPENTEAASAPAEAVRTGAPESEASEDSALHLGVPSIELFYDPARLGTWLAESACRLAGGSAAVLWRRDSDGQRYTLVAYAPNSDALPTIPFPPTQLEEYVRAGRVQAVAPDHFVSPDAAPPPFHFLAVPLPGATLSQGLLGVFRPTSAGDFPRGAISELSARASELGIAVERCFQFARMNQELRGLRFKERVRDLMLEQGIPETERWSRLLRFLIEEIPADFAQFYRLSDDGLRLSLVAFASGAEEFEGWVSVPAGRGIIGSALERERPVAYTGDDHADPRALYLLPVRARRLEGLTPVGVVVLDNAHDRTSGGEDTLGLLETTAAIMAPLLSTLPIPARA